MTQTTPIPSPSNGALPENVGHLLGLTTPGMVERVLATPALRSRIDARLNAILGDRPPLPADAAACLQRLLDRSPDAQTRLSRCMGVLLNRDAILACTNGAQIRSAIDFAGAEGLVAILRRTDVPRLQRLPAPQMLVNDALGAFAQRARQLTLGLLPPPYVAWLALTVPRNGLPSPEVLPVDAVDDRAALIRLIGLALDLTEAEVNADAHHQVA